MRISGRRRLQAFFWSFAFSAATTTAAWLAFRLPKGSLREAVSFYLAIPGIGGFFGAIMMHNFLVPAPLFGDEEFHAILRLGFLINLVIFGTLFLTITAICDALRGRRS
jgi:hypothetical protein